LFVIAGHGRSKNGVASLAYDPATQLSLAQIQDESTGSSPVMTRSKLRR
jgi:hypothetical protein